LTANGTIHFKNKPKANRNSSSWYFTAKA